jgi:hypothetical protein
MGPEEAPGGHTLHARGKLQRRRARAAAGQASSGRTRTDPKVMWVTDPPAATTSIAAKTLLRSRQWRPCHVEPCRISVHGIPCRLCTWAIGRRPLALPDILWRLQRCALSSSLSMFTGVTTGR